MNPSAVHAYPTGTCTVGGMLMRSKPNKVFSSYQIVRSNFSLSALTLMNLQGSGSGASSEESGGGDGARLAGAGVRGDGSDDGGAGVGAGGDDGGDLGDVAAGLPEGAEVRDVGLLPGGVLGGPAGELGADVARDLRVLARVRDRELGRRQVLLYLRRRQREVRDPRQQRRRRRRALRRAARLQVHRPRHERRVRRQLVSRRAAGRRRDDAEDDRAELHCVNVYLAYILEV